MKALVIPVEVPCHHPQPHSLEPVSLNAILPEELLRPADGSQPMGWLLAYHPAH